jgi:hypothetical protein
MQMRIAMGLMIWALLSCTRAHADSVELANGDLLSGKVTAVTGEQVLLTSEVLGEVKLPRAKVAAIHFGDRKPTAAGQAGPASSAGASPSQGEPSRGEPARWEPSRASAAKGTPEAQSVDDVLNQLKVGGAGGDLTKMLNKEFPLLQNPSVKAYFDKTVGGLMSGELNVSDIRKQAIEVQQQVKELEKDLGPEGMAALKPYLSVLDKFIKDTEPPARASAPAQQKPAAGVPADLPKRP